MSINAQTTKANTQATGMAMMKMFHREHALNKMFLFKLLCFIFIWSSDRFGISPADCKCRQKLFTQVKGKFFVTCSIIYGWINVKKWHLKTPRMYNHCLTKNKSMQHNVLSMSLPNSLKVQVVHYIIRNSHKPALFFRIKQQNFTFHSAEAMATPLKIVGGS